MSNLADEFPKINICNYNEDDVAALNTWGIKAVDALRAAEPSRDAALDVMASLPPDLPNGWMSAATKQPTPRKDALLDKWEQGKYPLLGQCNMALQVIVDLERELAAANLKADTYNEKFQAQCRAADEAQRQRRKVDRELAMNAKMLARQCDLARQAETEIAALQARYASALDDGLRKSAAYNEVAEQCDDLQAHVNEAERKLAEAENFQRFAIAVLEESREELTDINGGWLQDTAEEFGLLERITVTEPCGEMCRCEDFPQECLRYPQSIKAAIDSARGAKEPHD